MSDFIIIFVGIYIIFMLTGNRRIEKERAGQLGNTSNVQHQPKKQKEEDNAFKKATLSYIESVRVLAKSSQKNFTPISDYIFDGFIKYEIEEDTMTNIIQSIRNDKYKDRVHYILEGLFSFICFEIEEHEILRDNNDARAELQQLGSFFIDKMQDKGYIDKCDASCLHIYLLECILAKPHEVTQEHIKELTGITEKEQTAEAIKKATDNT